MTEIVKPISRLGQLAGEQDCRHNSRLRNQTMGNNHRHNPHQRTRHHHQATEDEEEEVEVDEVDAEVEVVEEIATRTLCDVERLATTASEAR